jgi:hypothetical protein
MSDAIQQETPAPNGHDQTTYTVTDTESAAAALNGLLFDPPEARPDDEREPRQDQPPSSREDETGAAQPPPTDDQDGGQSEAAQPPIEAPQSWPAEAKAAFTKLPPDLQQTVLQRESQREAALTQRAQEAAEARRLHDTERQAALAQRADYLESLQKMALLVMPEYQALQQVDWQRVQAESPAEFTRLQALELGVKQKMAWIEQEWQGRVQQNQKMQQEILQQVLAEQRGLLTKVMPDYADEARAAPLRRDLGVYLRDVGGFTPQEINGTYDHRLVVMATKAMLYDRQNTAARTADTKRANPPARVQRPGNAPSGEDGGGGRTLQERVRQFGRTNSVRDAGRLLDEILS